MSLLSMKAKARQRHESYQSMIFFIFVLILLGKGCRFLSFLFISERVWALSSILNISLPIQLPTKHLGYAICIPQSIAAVALSCSSIGSVLAKSKPPSPKMSFEKTAREKYNEC